MYQTGGGLTHLLKPCPMPDVSKRCVFYVSGFDPKGAAHYHALYKDESARQHSASGCVRTVGPRQRMPSGNAFWDVRATCGEQVVQTQRVRAGEEPELAVHFDVTEPAVGQFEYELRVTPLDGALPACPPSPGRFYALLALTAGFAPLRLDLSQDVAFAASTIPLGVSLTRKGSS